MKTDILGFIGGHGMKRHQRKMFMEKKAKRVPKEDRDEEKIITVTVLVAIVILAVFLVSLLLQPALKEPFSAIYLLDSNKQTDFFPKMVVLGENSTFSLWVGVENQDDTTLDFIVLIKLDNGTETVNPSPANETESFERTLLDEQVWEFQVTINIDQLGISRIIFELWFLDDENVLKYSGNWVSLTLKAISP